MRDDNGGGTRARGTKRDGRKKRTASKAVRCLLA